MAWADEKSIPYHDVVTETERFVNHYLGNGETRADWNASWRNWMTSPLRSQGKARASPGNGITSEFDQVRAQLRGESGAAIETTWRPR